MLAADAELDAGPGLPSAFGRDLHEFAHAFGIERDERVGLENALREIIAKERAGSRRG